MYFPALTSFQGNNPKNRGENTLFRAASGWGPHLLSTIPLLPKRAPPSKDNGHMERPTFFQARSWATGKRSSYVKGLVVCGGPPGALPAGPL